MVTVLSLGGSIVAPEKPDERFLGAFRDLLGEFLRRDEKRRFILVVGGGGPARTWQEAYRNLAGGAPNNGEADWIGIMATRLNAQLVKAILGDW
jgi:uridylate kinase